MTEQEKKNLYWKACAKQNVGNTIRPPFVPSKVEVLSEVSSDVVQDETRVSSGVYECECNKFGAVSVEGENGRMLGLKPAEFELVEMKKNPEYEGSMDFETNEPAEG